MAHACDVSLDCFLRDATRCRSWILRGWQFLAELVAAQVFAEMHRVLKPGGLAIMSFSNRCFPTKGAFPILS